ncbi:MAG: hypothetical protein JNJ55_08540, partial [Betaproteobacteria bacterium]|nr:hypothetical protein [Betaproteobacteria bacterium]
MNVLRPLIVVPMCLLAACAIDGPRQAYRGVLQVATSCEGLDALSPDEAALRIGHDPVVFKRIKSGSGKSNAEICALPQEEAARIMLAERNKQRTPESKKMKAPLTEWVRTWDMDESGRLPTSSDFLKAEAQRVALTSNVRRSGRGEANTAQAAGLSNAQWTEIGP